MDMCRCFWSRDGGESPCLIGRETAPTSTDCERLLEVIVSARAASALEEEFIAQC